MITTSILTIFYNFIFFILAPIRSLSDVALSGDFLASISAAGGYLSALDEIIPVYVLLAVLGAILGVEAAILAFKFIRWIYQKIPGVN